MKDALYFGTALLLCGGMLSSAGLQANPPGSLKPPSPPDLVEGKQAVPIACSKANPPLWCATPPRVVFAPSPELPEQAAAKEMKGVCVLETIVEADGTTSHIRVVAGLGMGLDEKAIEAVKRWKFKPAMLKGKPVAVKIAVEVDFSPFLKGEPQK